jgi:hypothetical protein
MAYSSLLLVAETPLEGWPAKSSVMVIAAFISSTK